MKIVSNEHQIWVLYILTRLDMHEQNSILVLYKNRMEWQCEVHYSDSIPNLGSEYLPSSLNLNNACIHFDYLV